MQKIAEFSMPRVLEAVAGSLALLLLLGAYVVWTTGTGPIVPPRRSPESQAIRDVIALTTIIGSGAALLGWTGLILIAPFRHQGAAVFVLEDKAVLFNGGFFRSKSVTSIREVNITWDQPAWFRSLEVVLETGRRIYVPLGHLRGEPEAIRQRLWDAVQAAKAQGRGG
jgi:hypothetical protein